MVQRSVFSKNVALYACVIILTSFITGSFLAPPSSAQTQYVTASPGYINLGMNTTITVAAPSSGSYTLVVQNPSKVESNFSEILVQGQASNRTFLASSVGIYNVFLVQGANVISATTFYATNKLDISMSMVNGGTCSYVAGVTRGVKMFPRFSITYASTGAQVTNNDKGISVVFTEPGGGTANAGWDSGAKLFVGDVLPNWNYTNVGPWNPSATVTDSAGNSGNFTYVGSPYVISPATLSTTITLVDSNSNQTITSLYSGENVTVYATITYPSNAEPVKGFVGPLDQTARGGVVTGVIGYGAYNQTSQTFTGTSSGTIAKISLSYTGAGGIWKGSFSAGSLPALGSSQTFQVVVSSHDNASPPNTGTSALGLALGGSVSSSTHTTSQVSTPVWAYAGITIALIIGIVVGFLVRKR